MTERDRAIELAISQIERQFGKGAIMKMGEANSAMQIDSIPTGSIALDLALGIGGIPRGRITEIYGPESSGKTTLALHVIAEAQRMGGIAAYVDAEHALDPLYASRLGVNLEELLISQPDTGEQALEIVDALVRSGSDEFALVLPGSPIEAGTATARRIVSAIADWGHEDAVTVSAGVASMASEGAADVLTSAMEALAEAKAAGTGRIAVA